MEKYVKYSSKAWAQKKVDSINAQCKNTIWIDGITNNYCHIEETENGEFLIPILKGYEQFF